MTSEKSTRNRYSVAPNDPQVKVVDPPMARDVAVAEMVAGRGAGRESHLFGLIIHSFLLDHSSII